MTLSSRILWFLLGFSNGGIGTLNLMTRSIIFHHNEMDDDELLYTITVRMGMILVLLMELDCPEEIRTQMTIFLISSSSAIVLVGIVWKICSSRKK